MQSSRLSVVIHTVANSVVQREKHTLNGATLDVSLEVCEGQSKVAGKTIKVTGLAAKTTKDSIINYFENKRRSGGGAVESVEFQSDAGVALVTFEDANGKCFEVVISDQTLIHNDERFKIHYFVTNWQLIFWCLTVEIGDNSTYQTKNK